MDFYVKDAQGNLVKATMEQLFGKDVLYNSKGEVVNRPGVVKDDPIAELTAVIKDMAIQTTGLNSLKEKVEKVEAENVKLKEDQIKSNEMISRGFIMGSAAIDNPDEKTMFGWQTKSQGLDLMDRFRHPHHQITEPVRIELAKYFTCFAKAAFFDDLAAKQEFRRRYSRKTGSTDIGDHGNEFPIPDIVEAEVLAFAREKSVVLQDARVVPMVSEKQSYPAEATGVAVAWGNTTNESNPTVSEVELSAEELSAYASAKNATMADARTDIVSWLTEVMAEAVGLELDNASFNGDGTSTYGNTSGLLTSACGYSVTMSAGSTGFNYITAAFLSEMISKLDGLKKQGAKFYTSGGAFHYIRSLVDSNNRPVFYELLGGVAPGSQILGYPYTECIKITGTSAANTAFILFGNLRNLLVGRRLDTMSLQVDPYGLWTTNRTRFKIYNRWAIKMGLTTGFVRGLTAAA